MFITNGGIADFGLVAAKTDKDKGYAGISIFLVDTNTPGFTVSRDLEKLGWKASNTAELAFDDVRVPASAMLGEENQGFYNIMAHFQEERLYLAAGSVCGAQKALELAAEYAKERVQFGRAIASFQVTRHKIADMSAKVDQIEAYLNQVCWLINEADMPVAEICKLKFAATKALEFCASEAMPSANPMLAARCGSVALPSTKPQR